MTKRISFGWELGGGFGHWGPLQSIARRLVATGHPMQWIVKDLSRLRSVFRDIPLEAYQALIETSPADPNLKNPPISGISLRAEQKMGASSRMVIDEFEVPIQFMIPFRYAREPATSGSRIGGFPPRLATPQFDVSPQKYFATLELPGELAISIFYSLNAFGEMDKNHVIMHGNRILYQSALIHAVVHPISAPDDSSAIAVEVSNHAIIFGEQSLDVLEPSTPTIPNSVSKLGGRPFAENPAMTSPPFDALKALGFLQLAQFYSQTSEEMEYVVDFPWDPGWLHVFVKGESRASLEFAFVIQN